MGTAFVSFGGNVGDVAETFDQAAEMLNAAYGEVVRLSSLFSTSAVGEDAGDPFLNAVAQIETHLTPEQLLDGLLEIEERLGRERTVRWGPRTLDLDLLLYDDVILETEKLVLPHPRCWYRKFVLDGLAEIGGKVQHPLKRVSMSQLKSQITRVPFELGITEADTEVGTALLDYVNSHYLDADAIPWTFGDPNPNLIIWHAQTSYPFQELPLLPRLDLTREVGSPEVAIRDVLASVGKRPV
ncbi:MAG: 2-amino-4-hydroxy-6-hydroxymethyldihydropteridine diphosphokinase [Planctomycetaceae bacterium]